MLPYNFVTKIIVWKHNLYSIKLLVPMLNGFILLAFTVIHYLWITKISYIANILLYTSPIFHMKTGA